MIRHRPSGYATGWATVIEDSRTWTPSIEPTLVVAPHPDDECVATGGLVSHLRRRGAPVVVFAVTDGDAAYESGDRAALARRRRCEQHAALHALDVSADATWRAGLPDGRVSEHEHLLTDSIAGVASDRRLRNIVAPWPHDHHHDHESVGRAAAAAAAATGADLVFSVFWGLFHTPAPASADHSFLRLELTGDDLDRKRAAIECHRSQLTADPPEVAVLSDAELEPTTWPFELYLGRPS